MEDDNILWKMTEEKNRKIYEAMTRFLGHEPSELDKKEFRVMHGLGESTLYYQDVLIDTIKHELDDHSRQI
ncbi:MAG TPA: hypothetical protein VEX63_12020 [Flavisolibacter sp.]|jgi:hypothetical protein|nr:hypothetical protein [Flavisolibacter sp.]